MKAFLWDHRFETGIAQVDAQHRHLVEVVNDLGELLTSGAALEGEALQTLFHDLAQYAHRHFADEERLMATHAIDPQHLQTHAQHHREFIEQVLSLWRSRAQLAQPAETLHGFLAAWLTVHILGEDQSMARLIAASESDTATEAPELLTASTDSTQILLEALERLYGLLSAQNRNLAASNAHLEARVAERTQALLKAERMAAIGQLAAGLAHELNNPLGFISSNLNTLADYAKQMLESMPTSAAPGKPLTNSALSLIREELPDLIRESQAGMERVTQIIQILRVASRVDETKPPDLSLAECLPPPDSPSKLSNS